MGPVESQSLRHDQVQLCDWMWHTLAPTYGPNAATKLVIHDQLHVFESGAASLREMPIHDALTDMFLRLAKSQQVHGDGATTALLLASAIVKEVLRDGFHRDGLELARRQALSCIESLQTPATPLESLQPTWPWSALLLPPLLAAPHVDLSAVHVEIGDLGFEDGLKLDADCNHKLDIHGKVLAIEHWQGTPRSDVTLVLRDPTTAGSAPEPWRAWPAWGVQAVLVRNQIPEEAKDWLVSKGVLVCANFERKDWTMPCVASEHHARKETGTGSFWFDDGWRMAGVQTLRVPALNEWYQRNQKDAAERWLRTVGTVLESPGLLPATWRQDVAVNLRSVADHAPHRGPLVMRAVARAFSRLHELLDSPVDDPYATVRHAVSNSFAMASQMLRLDGIIKKAPSDPIAMRGGSGPAGSPKNMPGDIPPLM